MKIFLHHNVCNPTTHVNTVRGNPYCVHIDARSPHNTHPRARWTTPIKGYTSVTSFCQTWRRNAPPVWMFHSLHYFICCWSMFVLANRQQSAKNIGANIITRCSFKCIIPMHRDFLGRCILCSGWDLNWTCLEYMSEALLRECTHSVYNIHTTRSAVYIWHTIVAGASRNNCCHENATIHSLHVAVHEDAAAKM
jgi:hypothetical protein